MAEDRHFTVEQSESLQYLRDAIDMDRGDFSLIFAYCGYRFLRDRLITDLLATPDLNLEVVELEADTESLLTALEQHFQGREKSAFPDGILVRGFEAVEQLPELLRAINQVRESLKRGFPMPIVFWITPDVLKEIMNSAPDLESWAIGVDFEATVQDLSFFLEKTFEDYFQNLSKGIPTNTYFFQSTATLLLKELREIETNFVGQLEPENKACLLTLLGIANQRLYNPNIAIEYYEQAIALYTDLDKRFSVGFLYFLLSRTYFYLAFSDHEYVAYISPERMERLIREQRQEGSVWWVGYNSIHQALAEWQSCKQEEAIAWALPGWQRILSYLEHWEELEKYARQSLDILQKQQLAATKRLFLKTKFWLGNTLLAQGKIDEAKQYLQAVVTELEDENFAFPLARQDLAQIYCLEHQQGRALELLKEAENSVDIRSLSRAHIRILEQQRQILFELGRYLEAYKAKERKQLAEYEYSFKSFIGATRIQPRRDEVGMSAAIRASGRGRDVEKLVDWITGNEHAVTVIYGYSGVGKSSLVNAGLIPELAKNQRSAPNGYVQVVFRSYGDWQENLLGELRSQVLLNKGNLGGSSVTEPTEDPPQPPFVRGENIESPIASLSKGGGEAGGIQNVARFMDDPPQPPLSKGGENLEEQIFASLQKCDRRNQLVVLIFDQFEEFFFTYENEPERQQFFKLLGRLTNETTRINIVFSLRRDYMHFLLGRDQLKRSNRVIDLLSRDNGYELRNFSRDEAIAVFQRLTERTSFQPDEDLIKAVVDDLIDPATGRVRPIELQIVGRQLEETAGGITTLAAYQQQATQKGVKAEQSPKAVLVRSYLDAVVKDCGTEENQRLAYQLMFLLTDKQGRRPIKSSEELEAGIRQLGQGTENVGMILQILVLSDLVSEVQDRDGETSKYQLVHDYLVEYVRAIEEQDFESLFQAEFAKREVAEKTVNQLLLEVERLSEQREALLQEVNSNELLLNSEIQKQESVQQSIEQYLSEIEDLKHNREFLSGKIEEYNMLLNEEINKKKLVEERLNEPLLEIEQLKQYTINLEQDLEQTRFLLQTETQRREFTEMKLRKLLSKSNQLLSEVNQLKIQRSNIEQNLNQTKSLLQRETQRYQSSEIRLNQLLSEIEQLKIHRDSLEQEIKNYQSSLYSEAHRRELLERKSNQLLSEMNQMKAQRGSLEQEIRRTQSLLQAEAQKHRSIEAKLNNYLSEIQEFRQNHNHL